jgi:hypothetical protein
MDFGLAPPSTAKRELLLFYRNNLWTFQLFRRIILDRHCERSPDKCSAFALRSNPAIVPISEVHDLWIASLRSQ